MVWNTAATDAFLMLSTVGCVLFCCPQCGVLPFNYGHRRRRVYGASTLTECNLATLCLSARCQQQELICQTEWPDSDRDQVIVWVAPG